MATTGRANGLTLLQRRFINEYFLTGGNATESARLAGYKGKDQTLGVVGHENLRKPKIREVIDKRLADESMGVDELIFRISQIARMDLSPYVDQKGRLVGVDLQRLIADGHGHLIKGVKQTKEGPVIEFKDSQKAMDQLMKYYSLDNSGVNVNIDQRSITVVYADE